MTRRRIQASPPPISAGEAANLRSLSAPACGDCGMCSLCDAVLAYEDDALALRTSAQPHDAAVALPPLATPPAAASASAALVSEERGVALWRASWEQLAEVARAAGGVDSCIHDGPFSERTHKGHDDGTSSANRVADWGKRERAKGATHKRGGVSLAQMERYAAEHGTERSLIDYPPWTEADVRAFVATWAPLTRGWFATLTDHVLAPFWEKALQDAGRYVFSPLSCMEPGSRFRSTGEGPSQWSCLLIVARPSSGAWIDAWRAKRRAEGAPCALRGGFLPLPGEGDAQTGSRKDRVTGAKPLWLMRDIVEDYSCRGDLVADPTCGGGTTGLACIAEGRRALLGDRDVAHVEIARKRLLSCPGEQRRLTLDVDAKSMSQLDALFGAWPGDETDAQLAATLEETK